MPRGGGSSRALALGVAAAVGVLAASALAFTQAPAAGPTPAPVPVPAAAATARRRRKHNGDGDDGDDDADDEEDEGMAMSGAARRALWLRLSAEAGAEGPPATAPLPGLAALRAEFAALIAAQATLLPAPAAPASADAEEDRKNFDAIARDVGRTFSAIYAGREGAAPLGAAAPVAVPAATPSPMTAAAAAAARDRTRLSRVLCAYAVHDRAVGYVQGMNFLAAFCLSRLDDEADAYALLVRLMQAPRYAMRNLFLPNLPDVRVSSYILKRLVWDALPSLAAHLETVGVDAVFFFEWYFALFVLVLPPDQCACVWDGFLAEGWPAAFRAVLALLQHLQPLLLGRDFYGTLVALKAYSNARTACEVAVLAVTASAPAAEASALSPAPPLSDVAAAAEGASAPWARALGVLAGSARAALAHVLTVPPDSVPRPAPSAPRLSGSTASAREEQPQLQPPSGLVRRARRRFGGLVTAERLAALRALGLRLADDEQRQQLAQRAAAAAGGRPADPLAEPLDVTETEAAELLASGFEADAEAAVAAAALAPEAGGEALEDDQFLDEEGENA